MKPTNTRITIVAIAALSACIAEEPSTRETAAPIVADMPDEAENASHVVPKQNPVDYANSEASAIDAGPGGDCTFLKPYCGNPYGWPLTGATKCYCQCNTQADCAGMPTAKECGVAFDVYDVVNGVYKHTMPNGDPTVCLQPGNPIPSDVP